MYIGEELLLNWNTAKELGDELLSGAPIRIEAFGHDWVVVRGSNGRAHAASFETYRALFDWYKSLDRYDEE